MLASLMTLPTAQAAAVDNPVAPASSGMMVNAEVDAHGALPPEGPVRQALESLPEVKAARAAIDYENATRKRLRAGPYEWSVSAGVLQRRDIPINKNYKEPEIAIERQMRWFGKQDKDIAIGEQGVMRAEAGLGDAWHESAKILLLSWFDWQKEFASIHTLGRQLKLLEQQTAVAQRRFKAGDAAKTETLLAMAEQQRVMGQLQLSQARADALALEIERRFPGVNTQGFEHIPTPTALVGNTDDWVHAILRHNHELEILQADQNQARLLAERSRLERMPDPMIALRAAQERDRAEKLLGVTVSIALPGQGRQAQAEQALAAQAVTDQASRKGKTRIERDAVRTVNQAQAAYQSYVALKTSNEQSQESARLLERAYRLGEASLTDTLLSRRQALEAQLAQDTAQLDALYAYYRVMLDAHELWALAEHDDH